MPLTGIALNLLRRSFSRCYGMHHGKRKMPMKNHVATAVVSIALGVAIGFGSASFGLTPHDHSSHTPMPIPDSWTDAQVAAFIAESDRKIDTWAGRIVPPGEVITHDGL